MARKTATTASPARKLAAPAVEARNKTLADILSKVQKFTKHLDKLIKKGVDPTTANPVELGYLTPAEKDYTEQLFKTVPQSVQEAMTMGNGSFKFNEYGDIEATYKKTETHGFTPPRIRPSKEARKAKRVEKAGVVEKVKKAASKVAEAVTPTRTKKSANPAEVKPVNIRTAKALAKAEKKAEKKVAKTTKKAEKAVADAKPKRTKKSKRK